MHHAWVCLRNAKLGKNDHVTSLLYISNLVPMASFAQFNVIIKESRVNKEKSGWGDQFFRQSFTVCDFYRQFRGASGCGLRKEEKKPRHPLMQIFTKISGALRWFNRRSFWRAGLAQYVGLEGLRREAEKCHVKMILQLSVLGDDGIQRKEQGARQLFLNGKVKIGSWK